MRCRKRVVRDLHAGVAARQDEHVQVARLPPRSCRARPAARARTRTDAALIPDRQDAHSFSLLLAPTRSGPRTARRSRAPPRRPRSPGRSSSRSRCSFRRCARRPRRDRPPPARRRKPRRVVGRSHHDARTLPARGAGPEATFASFRPCTRSPRSSTRARSRSTSPSRARCSASIAPTSSTPGTSSSSSRPASAGCACRRASRSRRPTASSALERADTIVVPGWSDPDDEPSDELKGALVAAHDRGARVVSLCTGAFVLAAAGLLDGRRATTHWMYAERLQRRYPCVRLDPDVLYVADDSVMTSAGTAAGIDLCLHLVALDHGVSVAAAVARRLVMPLFRSGGQAQYIDTPVATAPGDSLAPLLDWGRQHLTAGLSVDDLARRGAMSPRTLTRRFQASVGMPPGEWLQRERLRLAQQLLESTDVPIELVARRAGYDSATTMRAQFASRLHTSPRTYRGTFRSRELADDAAGDAGREHSCRHVANDHAAGADHRVVTDRDACTDHRGGADPHVAADLDRLPVLEPRFALGGPDGVRRRADLDGRSDLGQRADSHRRNVEDDTVEVQEGTLAERDVPAVVARKTAARSTRRGQPRREARRARRAAPPRRPEASRCSARSERGLARGRP